jgi:hypothetical protein
MPRASKFESVWLNKTKKKNIPYTNLQPKYGIECWQYPTSFNDSDFIDGAHLNYKEKKKI